MSLESDNNNYYWCAIDIIDRIVTCMCLTLTPKETTKVSWAIMTFLWLMQILLAICTWQIMTHEPIDIIYFTLGTGNFDF